MVSWVVRRSSVVILVIAGLLTGCVGTGGASPSGATVSPSATQITLSIANYTSISVTLVVNGQLGETVPPGGYEGPIKASLPTLPWSVETRSPSGRALSFMTVRPGDVSQSSYPDGHWSWRGDAVRVDLSCGRLDVWSGPPILGPAPPSPASTAGDCD